MTNKQYKAIPIIIISKPTNIRIICHISNPFDGLSFPPILAGGVVVVLTSPSLVGVLVVLVVIDSDGAFVVGFIVAIGLSVGLVVGLNVGYVVG